MPESTGLSVVGEPEIPLRRADEIIRETAGHAFTAPPAEDHGLPQMFPALTHREWAAAAGITDYVRSSSGHGSSPCLRR